MSGPICDENTVRTPQTKRGYPVHILRPLPTGGFDFQRDALESILKNRRVKDKPISVVSVAGPYRGGKSFLANLFIQRMLYFQLQDWMKGEDEVFYGFRCRGGSELDTTGIWLWSEPFLVSRGETEVAVLFMDTQGVFDSATSDRDSMTVFTLSALVSAVQVYNIKHNIQEDDIQYLSLWLKYAHLAQEMLKDRRVQFQKLLFLVRDWCLEPEYGEDVGRKILERRLRSPEDQPKEQKQVRQHLRACISDICCFMLPYPGKEVATGMSRKFSHMEEDFKHYVLRLTDYLLKPEKLVTKKINDRDITCQQWADLFSSFFEIFRGNQLPDPISISQVLSQTINRNAMQESQMMYVNGMNEFCGGRTPYRKFSHLEEKHRNMHEEAVGYFSSHNCSFGGNSVQEEEHLKKEIKTCFEEIVQKNREKLPSPTMLFLCLGMAVSAIFIILSACIAVLMWNMWLLMPFVSAFGVLLLLRLVFSIKIEMVINWRRRLDNSLHASLESRPWLYDMFLSFMFRLYDWLTSFARQLIGGYFHC